MNQVLSLHAGFVFLNFLFIDFNKREERKEGKWEGEAERQGREMEEGTGRGGGETDRETDINQLLHPFMDSWVGSCMCFDPD